MMDILAKITATDVYTALGVIVVSLGFLVYRLWVEGSAIQKLKRVEDELRVKLLQRIDELERMHRTLQEHKNILQVQVSVLHHTVQTLSDRLQLLVSTCSVDGSKKCPFTHVDFHVKDEDL